MDENNVCVQWPQSSVRGGWRMLSRWAYKSLFFTLSPSLTLLFCHRGKTNYINLGSFLIKPVQRVMRYPLLLMELLNTTSESHHDRKQLAEAVVSIKEINVNINEYKRRKDLGISVILTFYLSVCGIGCLLSGCAFCAVWSITQQHHLLSIVVKYRKGDEDRLIDKISKLSMHSIIKKSNRVSSHLKHLTGFSPQVHWHCYYDTIIAERFSWELALTTLHLIPS